MSAYAVSRKVNDAMRIALRLSSLLILATATHAVAETATGWTLHPSVTARVGYDDNIFLQDRAIPDPLVTGAVPDGAGSAFVRVGVVLDAAWQLSPAFKFTAAYSPELVRYEEFSSENHDDHRLDLGLTGRVDAWSYQLKSCLLFIDGDDVAPTYGQIGGAPAIGAASIRSRREQFNAKLAGNATRTFDHGFVRVVGESLLNDYRTHWSSARGYANYVDRSEWNVGLDAGRNVKKDFALVTGVRVGGQYQDNLVLGSPTDPIDYSNTLVRALVGVEGQACSDLTVRLLAGPDFRHFDNHIAAGVDRSPTTRYIEASATWTPRKTDSVTFAYKDYLWVSSGGRCAYQSATGDLQWKHAFNADWSASLGANVQAGDFRDYAANRLDWIYTGTVCLSRNLGAATKLDLEVIREIGDSAPDGYPGRDYSRLQVSLGLRRMF